MAYPLVSIEGTWEEIVTHAPEFAGRRLRVTVLAETEAATNEQGAPLDAVARLARLQELDRLTADMHPKPDKRDWLREGRSGGMYGFEPTE